MHKEHAQAFFNSMYFLAEAEKNKDSSRPFKEIVGEYIKELQQHQPSLLIFHNETDRQYPPFAKGDIGGFVQLTCAGLNKSPLPPFAKGGEPHSLLSERSVIQFSFMNQGVLLAFMYFAFS